MDRLEFDPPGLEPFKKGFETRGIVGQPSPPQTDFFGVEQTEVKSLLCDIVAKEVTFFHPTELQYIGGFCLMKRLGAYLLAILVNTGSVPNPYTETALRYGSV